MKTNVVSLLDKYENHHEQLLARLEYKKGRSVTDFEGVRTLGGKVIAPN